MENADFDRVMAMLQQQQLQRQQSLGKRSFHKFEIFAQLNTIIPYFSFTYSSGK